jgi:hypothetical protein
MPWAELLSLRAGTNGGMNWIWWWIVGYHKRQSISWAGCRNIRLFVSEERLCSIKVITQILQTSSLHRSPPNLPQAVTSPPNPPPTVHTVHTNTCNDNHMTFVCGCAFGLLNKDQPELHRIKTFVYVKRFTVHPVVLVTIYRLEYRPHRLHNCVIYYFVKDDNCFDRIRSSWGLH